MVLQPDMIQSKCYRIESLFTLRWLQFALPHNNAMPTHCCQFLLFLFVAFLVPANLRHPEVAVCRGNLAAGRTHDTCFQKMPMPETAVNKDASPVLP